MQPTRLMIRLYYGDLMIGPGKAALLAAVAEQGSISAAGRALGMSYKRAWQLIDQMNSALAAPVVISARGGPKGGGARLTPEGETLLAAYRRLEAKLLHDGAEELATIGTMIATE